MGVVDGQAALALLPEPGLDLGGLILREMGQTVQKMRVLSGTDRPVVDLGAGVTVTIEEQDATQPWRDRLEWLQDALCTVAKDHPAMDWEAACKALLEADGWSWTRVTFRTPMWMIDHDEILRAVVAREFEVLEWLARSSSATK